MSALAQSAVERIVAGASQAKDLEFPTQSSSLSPASTPEFALYKPDGPGPFPAMVLQPQCGGLRTPGTTWQNVAMLTWARAAVAHGYVALVVDSLGPRGVDSVCLGPKNGVTVGRGVRDAFQAAEHLRKVPYVDKERILQAGFSWGATAGVLASSKVWSGALATGGRFRAVAALYPGCWTVRPPGGQPFDLVSLDIDRPLLVLMGDKDTEALPSECLVRLEPLKASGAPVAWHLYSGATHCWDCENLDGRRKTDWRGADVLYSYDRALAADSVERVFAFFAANLSKP